MTAPFIEVQSPPQRWWLVLCDTNDKPKRHRNSGPLAPGECVDKLMDLSFERERRIAKATAKIDASLAEHRDVLIARVPIQQRGALLRMLQAVGVDTATLAAWNPQADPDPAQTATNDPELTEADEQILQDLEDASNKPEREPQISPRLMQPVEPVSGVEVDHATGKARRVGAGRS